MAALSAAEIRASVAADAARERDAVKRHSAILEVLAKYEGKKITKHMNKALGSIGMQLSERYGMTYVVPANQTMWKTDFSHQLAYDSDPFFRAEKFDQFDACQGKAATIRVLEREEWLKSDAPERLAAALGNMLSAVEAYGNAPFGPASSLAHAVVKKALEESFLWRVN